jgi:alkanesulfonate monooxygenase SsuD/methylene tetrahydromethanopterin reductase-like flavin-dependent oxidoreductase (luciferase family)
MRIAAKWAQWFNMSNPGTSPTDRIREMKAGIAEACASVKRDPKTLKTSLFVLAYVAPSRGELDDLLDELAKRANQPREQWLASRPGAITGTTDEAAVKFKEIASAGVDHANVMLPYGLELAGVKALAQIAKAR